MRGHNCDCEWDLVFFFNQGYLHMRFCRDRRGRFAFTSRALSWDHRRAPASWVRRSAGLPCQSMAQHGGLPPQDCNWTPAIWGHLQFWKTQLSNRPSKCMNFLLASKSCEKSMTKPSLTALRGRFCEERNTDHVRRLENSVSGWGEV